MSVGLLVVRLFYRFYVLLFLSKWFTFFLFLFVTFCRVVVFYACTQHLYMCMAHIRQRRTSYPPYIIAVCKCLQTFTNDCGIRVVIFQYPKYTTKANQSKVPSFIKISRGHFVALVFSGISVNGRPRISKVGNQKLSLFQ